mmetsp:Transcript_18839/g.8769  ORF Transcript_18839/g.8769 Transcript_18839/m.8769 type:complete len:269 (-) Transcript_18839:25-831(-)
MFNNYPKLLNVFLIALYFFSITLFFMLIESKEVPEINYRLEESFTKLKEGNQRFAEGNSLHQHTDSARLILAGEEDQGKHAFATVLACSDSRVPVELLFDAGIMDIFVVRVAGNVCDTDEIGSIEYGLAHVNTPVLVVLGHTKCGAVTTVVNSIEGKEHGHELELNIPPLIDNIEPAVKRALKKNSDIHGDDIIPYAIEENVWQSIEDLFMKSPATRELVKDEEVKVVGAIYDIGAGSISWLPDSKVDDIFKKVEANPNRIVVSSSKH